MADNFITLSEEKFPGRYDYTLTRQTYKNAKTPFKCYCKLHKKEFDIKVSNNHLKAKYGHCPDCKTLAKKDVATERQQTTGITKFIESGQEKFTNKFDYEITKTTFKGTKQSCYIHCNLHKIDFEIQHAENHLVTLCGGCPSCKVEGYVKKNDNSSNKQTLSIDDLYDNMKKRKIDNEIEEKRLMEKDEAYYLLMESLGGLECDQCEKFDENKYCETCNPKLNRIIREGIVDFCKWPIDNKIPNFCGKLLTTGKKACDKHINLFSAKDSGIKKCGKNGCHNTLSELDVYYCEECKRKNRENNFTAQKKAIVNENDVPEMFKQWLAGFFDGDGSIMYQCFKDKNTKSPTGFNLNIQFSQTSVGVLKKILKYYPTTLLYEDARKNETHKPGFVIKYNGIECRKILIDLLKYSILKKDQLLLGDEILSMTKSPAFSNRKYEIFVQMSNMKTNDSYGNVFIDIEKLTIPYIAGLFDAEGCIMLKNRYHTVSLAQDQSPNILKAIADLHDGREAGKDVRWYSQNAITSFLSKIEPYLTVKHIQACAMIQYLREQSKRGDYVAIIHKDKFGTRPDKEFLPISNNHILQKFKTIEEKRFGFVLETKYKEILEEDIENAKLRTLELINLELNHWEELIKTYKKETLQTVVIEAIPAEI